jgi:predicted nucleotidyltransferase component of viral defense system
MIDKREVLETASALGLLPNVVEKDYVLGWLLAGINAHPDLADSWVFKGGTCLKKCYFETYRFSEDLDFTLRDESQIIYEYSPALDSAYDDMMQGSGSINASFAWHKALISRSVQL